MNLLFLLHAAIVRKKFEVLGWKMWFTREDSNVEQDQE